MSIKVTIEHGEGNFRRVLDIGRVADGNPNDASDRNALNVYRVDFYGGRDAGEARFEHRYGDPLTALFEKAIVALREAGVDDSAVSA